MDPAHIFTVKSLGLDFFGGRNFDITQPRKLLSPERKARIVGWVTLHEKGAKFSEILYSNAAGHGEHVSSTRRTTFGSFHCN